MAPMNGTTVNFAAIFAPTACLGFVPVAVHFDLFGTLVRIGKPASSREVLEECELHRSAAEKAKSPLCALLTSDTLHAMAGLGLVDLAGDDTFQANAATNHAVSMPSTQLGATINTSEIILASAFIMRKLVDTNFEYPFKENDTPYQHAFRLMGDEDLAKKDLFSILHERGRLNAFNTFMASGYQRETTMPEKLNRFGYDLDAAVGGAESNPVIVDIGGGVGRLLLQFKDAYPYLQPSNLILQEHNPGIIDVPGITVMDWDYKQKGSPQPIQNATIYILSSVLHNLPDSQAVQLLQKIREAMGPHSRLLIQEVSKDRFGSMSHASMIIMLGGRERSSAEWKKLASQTGMEVTFEAYPPYPERGVVEMRRIEA